MKILIVEDEDDKIEKVTAVIRSLPFPNETVMARSLQAGIRAISSIAFDLVILDMTLPSFDISDDEDGGRTQADGGRELVRRMARLEMDTPIAVLTQFDRFGKGSEEITLDELDNELREEYGPAYLGAIYYNPTYDTWREDLARVATAVRRRPTA